MIEQAIPTDALALAKLHYQTLTEGFLSQLGTGFLKSLYSFLIRNEIVLVSRENAQIVGFVSGSIRPDGMMIKFLILCPLVLIKLVWKSILKPGLFRSLRETFKVPEKSKSKLDADTEILESDAELLSMSVDPAYQRKGIGTLLLNAMEQHLRKLGVKKYKIIAVESLVEANLFFLKNGFYLVQKIKVHNDRISNEYAKEL